MAFSDQFRYRVEDNRVRLSIRITEHRVDEYWLPQADVLPACSPAVGADWEGSEAIQVKVVGRNGFIRVRVSATKSEIYSMRDSHLRRMLAELRAHLRA